MEGATSMNTDLDIYSVLNLVGVVVLVALVIPFVIFAVPASIGADASHVVLSGSMEPAISPGDAVIVNDVKAANIEQGDIITYGTGDSDIPVTHRVVEVLNEEDSLAFMTKGDANEDADATPVPAANVEGKVLLTIPFIGHVIAFAGEPLGALLFMGVPFALLILSEIWKLAFDGKPISKAIRGLVPDESNTSAQDSEPNEAAEEGPSQPQQTGQAAASGAGTAETANEKATVTITRDDLQLTLAVMGVFAAYAVWIFYQRWIVAGQRTPVPLSAAIATTAGLLVLLVAYLGRPEGEESTSTQQDHQEMLSKPQRSPGTQDHSASAGVREDPGTTKMQFDEAGRKPSSVGTVGEIIDTAISTQTPIEWRPWNGTFRVSTPSNIYVCASEREGLDDIEGQLTGSEPSSPQDSQSGTERKAETESSESVDTAVSEATAREDAVDAQGEGVEPPFSADIQGSGDDD